VIAELVPPAQQEYGAQGHGGNRWGGGRSRRSRWIYGWERRINPGEIDESLIPNVSSRVVGVEERVEFRVGSKESRAGSKGTEEEARRHGRQLEEEEQYSLTDIRYSSPLSTQV
jgi:hypothetical protein